MKMYFGKQTWLKAPLLLCLAVGQVQAATITADGSCTLADAITAANTDTATGNCISGDAGKDTIELTYSPLLPEEQLSLPTETIIITPPITPIPDDNEKMLPQIATEIFINGNGNTIDGNKDSAVGSVLHISSNGNLTLNEVTVTGGHQGLTDNGGGIHNEFGIVTLINSTVSRNQAADYGGGIYSNGGSLTLTNSTVSNNLIYPENGIETSYGGGIYSNGSSLTLTNSTVSGNWAFYGNGGGIYIKDSTLSLTDSTINKNEAILVGGIYSDNGSTVTLTNSTVSKNKASYGGGICVSNSTLKLINSTVSENLAVGGGGFNFGGGIIIGGSTVTLTNSTVSKNEAINDGGGIFISDSTVTLTSSLISGNRSTTGEGNELYNYDSGTIYADSSNIFGHSDESDTEAFVRFTPGNSDINATSDGTSGILKPTALSAILLPLADNGGPTQTHALVTDSPAVDLDTACSGNLTEDQRGEPRPDTGCDAGAFEGSISLSNSTAFLPTLYLLLLNN